VQLSPSQNKAGGQESPACEQEADEWWPCKITEVVSTGLCSKERNAATVATSEELIFSIGIKLV